MSLSVLLQHAAKHLLLDKDYYYFLFFIFLFPIYFTLNNKLQAKITWFGNFFKKNTAESVTLANHKKGMLVKVNALPLTITISAMQ